MDIKKLKAQIIIPIESEEEFQLFIQACQIDDFVNALKEIINFDPKMCDILEKHDILKFFT